MLYVVVQYRCVLAGIVLSNDRACNTTCFYLQFGHIICSLDTLGL
jgi:hypothetical protein